MIFRKPVDRLVLAGTKTQTRRPVTYHGGLAKPCPYRAGHDYAVQRQHGGQQIARVEILDVQRQRLGDISYPDVRAEGYRTTAEYADAWLLEHDRAWPPTEPCGTCAGFDIGDETCPDCGTLGGSGIVPLATTDEDVLARFHDRHADRLVWVLTFELRTAPRLLVPSGDGSGYRYRSHPAPAGKKYGRVYVSEHPEDTETDHGYTSTPARAMPGEPEAVDDVTLKRLVDDAHDRWAGDPGRRAEHARRLMRANQERIRLLIARGLDPADVLGPLEALDRHLRLLEEQTGTTPRRGGRLMPDDATPLVDESGVPRERMGA